jgi:hypothetical protein
MRNSRRSAESTCGTRNHDERRAATHARSELRRVARNSHSAANSLLKHGVPDAGNVAAAAPMCATVTPFTEA